VSEKEVLLKALETTILSFKAKTVDRMMEEVQQELKLATDHEEVLILLSKQKNFKDISKKINAQLGRIIVK
jgi:hypothetical protein